MVRNSSPMNPVGVPLIIPIVPPGRQTRSSSSAVSWWCGANIAPTHDVTTSNSPVSNGRASASASTHWRVMPASAAIRLPVSNGSGVRSDATTSAPASAAGIAAFPVPAATSSTYWPGSIPHAATSVGPSSGISWAATAG
jgi:hypothetical protein